MNIAMIGLAASAVIAGAVGANRLMSPPVGAGVLTPPAVVYASPNQGLAYNFHSVAYPPQSMLSDVCGRTVMFSADVPKVKVVPTFLEHDLDGVVLPR